MWKEKSKRFPNTEWLYACALVILFPFLLMGCTQNDRTITVDVDRSFVTGQPCLPPCWHGLELDKSSKIDVQDTLKRLPFVDQSSVREQSTVWLDSEAEVVIYSCLFQRDEDCGSVLLVEDRVKEITTVVRYDLTFEDVIIKLGSPEYVEYSSYHPEGGGCIISLFWPNSKIIVEFIDTDSDESCRSLNEDGLVPRGLQVTDLLYVSSDGILPESGDCCSRIQWSGFKDK